MSVSDLLQTVPTFALVLFRVAGMMLFAPLFGSARVPRRVKALLVIILAVGIIVSLFQAVTQIQEQTLTFIPKIAAMTVAAIVLMPWIAQRLLEYTSTMFTVGLRQ